MKRTLPDDQIAQIEEEIDRLTQRSKKITDELDCPRCHKSFNNKYYRESHVRKCLLKNILPIAAKATNNLARIAGLHGADGLYEGDGDEEINLGDDEDSDLDDDIELPDHLKPETVLAGAITHINQFNQIKQQNLKQKVKILVAEDYMPILLEKLGSKEAVYTYLKSCMYRKQAGDLDIFEKIYMEGRSPAYYPVKCLDRKTLRFAYINKHGKLVEGTNFVLKHIAGNVQDCYIQIQNEAIFNHVTKGEAGHNFLFNQHDVGGWQDHLVEYMDSKYQIKLLTGLADLLFEKIDEFKDNYLEWGMGHQFSPDELE